MAQPLAKLVVDGARLYVQQLAWAERQALRVLRGRMDKVAPAPSGDGLADASPSVPARMQELLERSLVQTPTSGQEELFEALVEQLVPDEARIVAALSAGTVAPLVHIHARTPSGILGKPLLENGSLVGRMANVALPDLTPLYVTKLLALGLLAVGPEDSKLKAEYEILMAEDGVRDAVGAAGALGARITRHTLSLSGLGERFWAAAESSG